MTIVHTVSGRVLYWRGGGGGGGGLYLADFNFEKHHSQILILHPYFRSHGVCTAGYCMHMTYCRPHWVSFYSEHCRV